MNWGCLKTPHFVILNEVKDLKRSDNEILHCVQNDKELFCGF